MSIIVGKISKKIKRDCKKFSIRLTIRQGHKRIYKSKTVLIKQINKKKRLLRLKSKFGCWDNSMNQFGRTSRFGNCGKMNSFGKRKINSKLRKICRLYRVKIGNKSEKVLAKQCLKRAKMALKNHKVKRSRSRFGNIFDSAGVRAAKDKNDAAVAENFALQKQGRSITEAGLNLFTLGIMGKSAAENNRQEARRIAGVKRDIEEAKRKSLKDAAELAIKQKKDVEKAEREAKEQENKLRQREEQAKLRQKQQEAEADRKQKLADAKAELEIAEIKRKAAENQAKITAAKNAQIEKVAGKVAGVKAEEASKASAIVEQATNESEDAQRKVKELESQQKAAAAFGKRRKYRR